MIYRTLAAALCLILVGKSFAAELPAAPMEIARVAPAADDLTTTVPGTVFNPAVAAPVQLELPLVGPLSQASIEASAAPSALAAARGADAALTSRNARENVAAARDAGVAVFDAQGPAAASSADAVVGSESGERVSLKQWVPHAITGLNLASGLGSIAFAAKGQAGPAAAMIALAAFFDGFDGLAARKLRVAGPTGVMLDSQADGVSFGAAPAFLALTAALAPLAHGDPVLYAAGFAAAAFSAFGAAYRLSRYNLDALAAGAGKEPAAYFKGLPSPGGALALAALTFALPALPAAAAFPAAVLGTAAVGALMMSRLPYLKITSSRKALLASAAVAATVAAPFLAHGAVALAPAAVVAAYLLSGPIAALGSSPPKKPGPAAVTAFYAAWGAGASRAERPPRRSPGDGRSRAPASPRPGAPDRPRPR